MEQNSYRSSATVALGYDSSGPGVVDQRYSFMDSVLTDAVLDELKKQSINGCLLCFFDTWDEEEWD